MRNAPLVETQLPELARCWILILARRFSLSDEGSNERSFAGDLVHIKEVLRCSVNEMMTPVQLAKVRR